MSFEPLALMLVGLLMLARLLLLAMQSCYYQAWSVGTLGAEKWGERASMVRLSITPIKCFHWTSVLVRPDLAWRIPYVDKQREQQATRDTFRGLPKTAGFIE